MRGVERPRGKDEYTYLVRGKVVDNNDPLNIGRVRVRIVHMHGSYSDDENEVLPPNVIPTKNLCWAFVAQPFPVSFESGSYMLPEIGSNVFVMFEDGDNEKPVVIGYSYGSHKNNSYKIGNSFKSETYTKDKGKRIQRAKAQEIPIEGQNSMDAKILYKSPKGSSIQIDDRDGKESIGLIDPVGNMIGIGTQIQANFSRNNEHSRKFKNANTENYEFSESKLNGNSVIFLKSLYKSVIKFVKNKSKTSIEWFLGKKGIITTEEKEKKKNGTYIFYNEDDKYELSVASDGISLVSENAKIKLDKENIEISSKNISINSESIKINSKSKIEHVEKLSHYSDSCSLNSGFIDILSTEISSGSQNCMEFYIEKSATIDSLQTTIISHQDRVDSRMTIGSVNEEEPDDDDELEPGNVPDPIPPKITDIKENKIEEIINNNEEKAFLIFEKKAGDLNS